MDQLTFSWAERPANLSASPDSEPVSTTSEATSASNTSALLTGLGLDGWSGRTSGKVLSSGGGRDFGTFLGALADIGYGFAYRVLDAQFFGVPQRRRRVFVVGYYGDPSPAGAVLLDTEGLLGHPPESEAAAERAANGAAYCSENHRIVGALDTECGLNKQTHQSLVNGHFALGTLTTRSLVALGARDVEDGYVIPAPGRRVRKAHTHRVRAASGFSDGYTAVESNGRVPDGPRYKALGNSMAVPVMRHIGKRIMEVEQAWNKADYGRGTGQR